jgi:hypothetical protein
VIKYETFIIKSFDQLKKHNFDQLIFGQTAPCLYLGTSSDYKYQSRKILMSEC